MSTKPPVISQSELPIPDGRAMPEAVNTIFLVAIRDTNVPQQLPGYLVGHTGVVRVRTTSGNAFAMTVALNREAAVPIADPTKAGASAQILPANTEVVFPVDNTARIWLCGSQGDSVQVSVKGTI